MNRQIVSGNTKIKAADRKYHVKVKIRKVERENQIDILKEKVNRLKKKVEFYESEVKNYDKCI